jgi:hypothetical protein
MSMSRTLALLLMASLPAFAANDCTVRSGPNTAALIELYTSEGCSSCPPADRWLSTFARAGPSPLVVPIAFHVSYWDYIGWKDAYADQRFGERQRERARASGAAMVYTPQVMVGGRDFSGWSSEADFWRRVESLNRVPARASLEVRALVQSGGRLQVTARAALAATAHAPDPELALAITQNGLSSRVTAGENRGEHLKHDFVVRDFRTFARARAASEIIGEVALATGAGWDLEHVSVIAFVQDRKTGEILQAVSAPVCRG